MRRQPHLTMKPLLLALVFLAPLCGRAVPELYHFSGGGGYTGSFLAEDINHDGFARLFTPEFRFVFFDGSNRPELSFIPEFPNLAGYFGAAGSQAEYNFATNRLTFDMEIQQPINSPGLVYSYFLSPVPAGNFVLVTKDSVPDRGATAFLLALGLVVVFSMHRSGRNTLDRVTRGLLSWL